MFEVRNLQSIESNFLIGTWPKHCSGSSENAMGPVIPIRERFWSLNSLSKSNKGRKEAELNQNHKEVVPIRGLISNLSPHTHNHMLTTQAARFQKATLRL